MRAALRFPGRNILAPNLLAQTEVDARFKAERRILVSQRCPLLLRFDEQIGHVFRSSGEDKSLADVELSVMGDALCEVRDRRGVQRQIACKHAQEAESHAGSERFLFLKALRRPAPQCNLRRKRVWMPFGRNARLREIAKRTVAHRIAEQFLKCGLKLARDLRRTG